MYQYMRQMIINLPVLHFPFQYHLSISQPGQRTFSVPCDLAPGHS